jgi:hypothetical protein
VVADRDVRILAAVAQHVQQQLRLAVVLRGVRRQAVGRDQVLDIGRVAGARQAFAVLEMVQAGVAHVGPDGLAVRREHQADEAGVGLGLAATAFILMTMWVSCTMSRSSCSRRSTPGWSPGLNRSNTCLAVCSTCSEAARSGDAVGQDRQHVAGGAGARHQCDPVVLLRAVAEVLRGSRF